MTSHEFCCTLPGRSSTDQLPSATIETSFNAVQLELPGVPRDPVAAEWRSPVSVLTDFLEAVGVSYPARAARSLLREFDSLADVLAAPAWRLRLVVGKRLAEVIRASSSLMKAELIERVKERPVVQRSPALLEYLQREVGFLDHERLLALYLDRKSRLMRIERIADGTLGEVTISAREVIGRGLAIGATAFILVHNHPSGSAVPSRSDLNVTSHLRALGKQVDLHLVDHLIVARGRFGSIEDFWRDAQWASEDQGFAATNGRGS